MAIKGNDINNDSAYPGYPHINNDDKSGCVSPFKSLDLPLNKKNQDTDTWIGRHVYQRSIPAVLCQKNLVTSSIKY